MTFFDMKIDDCVGRGIIVFVLFFFGSIGAKAQLWVEDFAGEADGATTGTAGGTFGKDMVSYREQKEFGLSIQLTFHLFDMAIIKRWRAVRQIGGDFLQNKITLRQRRGTMTVTHPNSTSTSNVTITDATSSPQ